MQGGQPQPVPCAGCGGEPGCAGRAHPCGIAPVACQSLGTADAFSSLRHALPCAFSLAGSLSFAGFLRNCFLFFAYSVPRPVYFCSPFFCFLFFSPFHLPHLRCDWAAAKPRGASPAVDWSDHHDGSTTPSAVPLIAPYDGRRAWARPHLCHPRCPGSARSRGVPVHRHGDAFRSAKPGLGWCAQVEVRQPLRVAPGSRLGGGEQRLPG